MTNWNKELLNKVLASGMLDKRDEFDKELKERSDKEHARLKVGTLYWAPNGSDHELVMYLGVANKPHLKPKNAEILFNGKIIQYWPDELIEVTEENIRGM
jgi:hypothetical protein